MVVKKQEELEDIEFTPFNTDGSPDTTVAPSKRRCSVRFRF